MKKIILSIFLITINILHLCSQHITHEPLNLIKSGSLKIAPKSGLVLLKDIYGNELIVNKIKLYKDTLFFEYSGDGKKIPINKIASINGQSEVDIKIHSYPDERSALITLRERQLSSFYLTIVTTSLLYIVPDLPILIIASAGTTATILHLSSYSGIKKMKNYQRATNISNLNMTWYK